MGGYGAIHTAFKHPELFGAVASLSGALSKHPPQPTVPPSPPTPWGIPWETWDRGLHEVLIFFANTFRARIR